MALGNPRLSETAPRRPNGAGLSLLLLAVIVGGGLRGYRLLDVGLSHFDEGIYALSGLWPWTGQFEANQHFYSPPLFPFLAGITGLLLGGPLDSAVLLVSFFFGTATIVLAWWLGRSWWDPATGVLAAWIFAVDGMQIQFARVGLTDATFTFLLLLSLGLLRGALEIGRWRGCLWAGLAVGFTWNTKVHGFLPLLLAGGFVLGADWRVRFLRLLLCAVVASLCLAPWLWAFHMKHGLGTLIAQKQGFVSGIAALPDNALRAIDSGSLMSNPAGGVVALVAVLSVAGFRQPSAYALGTSCLFLIGSRWSLVFWIGIAIASVIAGKGNERRALGWMLGWLLFLPALYSPYLRLWLPTESLVLLLGCSGIASLSRAGCRWTPARQFGTCTALGLACAAVVGWTAGMIPTGRLKPPANHGYRTAADQLVEWAERRNKRLVALARPPLFFYLWALNGTDADRLAGKDFELGRLGLDGALVLDHALQDAPTEFRTSVEESIRQQRLELVTSFPVDPSLVTKLDDDPSRKIVSDNDAYAVQVFQPTRQRATTSDADSVE